MFIVTRVYPSRWGKSIGFRLHGCAKLLRDTIEKFFQKFSRGHLDKNGKKNYYNK